jgi:hypothetical protein
MMNRKLAIIPAEDDDGGHELSHYTWKALGCCCPNVPFDECTPHIVLELCDSARILVLFMKQTAGKVMKFTTTNQPRCFESADRVELLQSR